jgi:hypothetical protein
VHWKRHEKQEQKRSSEGLEEPSAKRSHTDIGDDTS